jgi:hypothetical protein
MELKTKYQYTYFVHPFVVKENKYQKYLLKLIKDKNCNLKIFRKEKELRLYQYFLPKIREFLFSSFRFSKSKIKQLEELPVETRAAILAKTPCTIFEYSLEKDIQGKTEKERGIFFNIRRIEIVCFNTGICFLCMKTAVESSDNFADLLNFNYKFRDVNQGFSDLTKYDNIRLQTDTFADVNGFAEFIENLTGDDIQTTKYNVDSQRLLTYSYACIDQVAWNEEKCFENINYNFTKFANFLPADNSYKYNHRKAICLSKMKFAKLGISKQGMVLFASSADISNYTILPEEFEEEYFYTYIFNLYKRIYLKKLSVDFKNKNNLNNTRKQFINFTKTIWIEEITEDEVGTIINNKLNNVYELDSLYSEVKNRYDVLYKELNIERNNKYNMLMIIMVAALLVVNLINFFILNKN